MREELLAVQITDDSPAARLGILKVDEMTVMTRLACVDVVSQAVRKMRLSAK